MSTDDHVRAFDMLKSSLPNSVVLANPHFNQPDSLRSVVMKGTHDRTGHQGQTIFLDRDVHEYVRHCQRCIDC